MSNKIASTKSRTSMQDLVNAALSRTKVAEDAVGTSTSSGITIDKEDKPVVEGERAAAHDAANIAELGDSAAASTAPTNTGIGQVSHPAQGSKVAPIGEDPAQEAKATSLPGGIDSGTSLPGATLGGSTIETKIAKWQKETTELLSKLAQDQIGSDQGNKHAADQTVDSDNIYVKLAGGDLQLAQELYAATASEIAGAVDAGRKNADKVAHYLALSKMAEEYEEDDDDDDEDEGDSSGASEGGSSSGDIAAAASDSGGGDPAAAAAVGGDPMAAMGGGGDMGGGDGATAEAVLQLLSELSPEELAVVMQAVGGGDMGGGDMGGDPMAAMGGGGDMGGGALPTEALGGEDPMMDATKMASAMVVAMNKAAREQRRKQANSKLQASKIIREVLTRGAR